MKILLLIVWMYGGTTVNYSWEMDSMTDCMNNASAIDAEQATVISCVKIRKNLRK